MPTPAPAVAAPAPTAFVQTASRPRRHERIWPLEYHADVLALAPHIHALELALRIDLLKLLDVVDLEVSKASSFCNESSQRLIQLLWLCLRPAPLSGRTIRSYWGCFPTATSSIPVEHLLERWCALEPLLSRIAMRDMLGNHWMAFGAVNKRKLGRIAVEFELASTGELARWFFREQRLGRIRRLPNIGAVTIGGIAASLAGLRYADSDDECAAGAPLFTGTAAHPFDAAEMRVECLIPDTIRFLMVPVAGVAMVHDAADCWWQSYETGKRLDNEYKWRSVMLDAGITYAMLARWRTARTARKSAVQQLPTFAATT